MAVDICRCSAVCKLRNGMRQGAGQGRQVLWVWDQADVDVAPPINQGVTADQVLTERRGIRIREITFCNPCDGEVYVYLPTELTLEPGLLALLYKTRWEIEQVFDETKTKLAEKKSWATTLTAKEMPAHFVALVHNLLLLLQDWQQQQGVENTAEIQRRQKRLAQQETELQKTGRTLPLIYRILQRCTPAPFKLIRWLRVHWHRPTPLAQALLHLRSRYAKL